LKKEKAVAGSKASKKKDKARETQEYRDGPAGRRDTRVQLLGEARERKARVLFTAGVLSAVGECSSRRLGAGFLVRFGGGARRIVDGLRLRVVGLGVVLFYFLFRTVRHS